MDKDHSSEPSESVEQAPSAAPGAPGRPAGWYQAMVTLAIHGQENKWWMIYIFLVFNSLLVLACATFLSVGHIRLLHQLLVTVLCAAGLLVAVVWLFMIPDYVAASNLYGDAAEAAERDMPASLVRPFSERQAQRALKSRLGTIKTAALSLAAMFLLVYALFLIFTWWTYIYDRPH